MGKEEFVSYVKEVASSLEDKSILIIHHDDADGICSAAILKETFTRINRDVKLLCLEKLFPEVVRKVHEDFEGTIIYADIGSPHVRLISSLNKGKNRVIILDHHDTERFEGKNLFNVNPELFGLKGEVDASGSTVCYFFSKLIDRKNVDLSYLALVGSCEIPLGFVGLNRIAFEDAKRNGLINKRLFVKKLGMSLKDVFKKLQILGPVGYYKDGPRIGIEACLKGFDEKIVDMVKELEEERKRANKRMLTILYKTGLRKVNGLQWFHAGDNFSGMGTKVIGTFCSYLSFQRLVDQDKYILGFMNMSNEIPGFGKLSKDYVKVSARVPKKLKEEIGRGDKEPLSFLLPKACERVGGFGDGHAYAASGVVPKGEEEELVNVFSGLVGQS